jgi:hypothetical protein
MVDDRLHTVGVALIALAGAVAVANGLWFVVGEHPFDDGGYSEEVDLTHSEAADVTPELPDWLLHVSDQVGSVTTGWGLFVISLAALEHRRRDRAIQAILAIGGLPTLVFSAFGEHAQFGTVDTGTLLSVLVLAAFVLGLGLVVVTTRR